MLRHDYMDDDGNVVEVRFQSGDPIPDVYYIHGKRFEILPARVYMHPDNMWAGHYSESLGKYVTSRKEMQKLEERYPRATRDTQEYIDKRRKEREREKRNDKPIEEAARAALEVAEQRHGVRLPS